MTRPEAQQYVTAVSTHPEGRRASNHWEKSFLRETSVPAQCWHPGGLRGLTCRKTFNPGANGTCAEGAQRNEPDHGETMPYTERQASKQASLKLHPSLLSLPPEFPHSAAMTRVPWRLKAQMSLPERTCQGSVVSGKPLALLAATGPARALEPRPSIWKN